MLSPNVGEKPLAEQAIALAYQTPTVYSAGTQTPFEDIGMGDLSDEEVGAIFEGQQVLDIGSGAEGIARRLFRIFGNSQLAPQVIYLNPQLGDSRMSHSVIG